MVSASDRSGHWHGMAQAPDHLRAKHVATEVSGRGAAAAQVATVLQEWERGRNHAWQEHRAHVVAVQKASRKGAASNPFTWNVAIVGPLRRTGAALEAPLSAEVWSGASWCGPTWFLILSVCWARARAYEDAVAAVNVGFSSGSLEAMGDRFPR